MTLLLRKGALSRCILAMSSRPISSDCAPIDPLFCFLQLLKKVEKSIFGLFLIRQWFPSGLVVVMRWARIGPAWARVAHPENPEFYTRDKPLKLRQPEDTNFTYRIAHNHVLRGEFLRADHIMTALVGACSSPYCSTICIGILTSWWVISMSLMSVRNSQTKNWAFRQMMHQIPSIGDITENRWAPTDWQSNEK
uniref:Cytochrome c oxidase subunit I n=1 Tax=Ditylenchus dipsaci TaxID=166011 RepID=A0A915E343_9BILA